MLNGAYMCDILVVTPRATENGVMLFAKNSDRDPNEAQILEFIPRKRHSEEKVKLTYVDFPQAEETYAVILSCPWWMWGAEIGANEFGLVIGNTAVFTKEKYEKTGILGMDMIRLALERKKSAKEALDFIISIIEKYGLGGSGSYEHKLFYHNSFVIADPKEAWILETAGKYWVAKKVENFYSISNALTIDEDWDLASEGVKELAKKKSFSFAKHFSDRFYTHFAHGRERRAFTYAKLKEKEGEINLEYLMGILRSHQVEPFSPEKGSMRDVCMHFGGLTRPSQTSSSQISELDTEFQVHWFTGTSLPCLSIFKPVYFETGLPDLGERPTNRYNPNAYWWRFEAFHRKFQTNYEQIKEFSKDRDQLQRKVVEKEREVRKGYLMGKTSKEELFRITKWAFEVEKRLLEKWNVKLKSGKLPLLYRRKWKKVNEKAGLKI